MEAKGTSDYRELSPVETLKRLQARQGGLTGAEAESRAKEFGYNEVPDKKVNPYLDFLSRFWGPIPWLLEFAVVLSWVLGDKGDALVIFMLLFLNTAVAYYNESNSQKALELLKKKLTIKARLLRDGKWSTQGARELVPGDIIVVGLGDVVPADAKIISGEVSADQSALTGESLPVNLHDSDLLFTGSVVKRGEAKCVVLNTGMRTYFGKTVELVNIAKPKSRQEEIMLTICRYMLYLGIIGFIIILGYSLFVDVKLAVIMTFAVLFIGGGVPAALPVFFTLAQSKGATELASNNILVTRLDAMENAASVEILCLDKTGTITMNEMRISEAAPFQGFSAKELALLAGLASSPESKDAIDTVVLEFANGQGLDFKGYSRLSFAPFEPATKRAEAVVQSKEGKFRAMKGAAQTILALCGKTPASVVEEANRKIAEMSKKGCRVLAVAKGEGRQTGEGGRQAEGLKFAGLLALSDPLRPDSAAMISEMKAAGIRPIMLTGDNISVATEIAAQAGIGSRIVRLSEINALPVEQQAKAIMGCDGVAEIYPEDKYRIVKLLQAAGSMVGMTGDGVNDAPALKQAEMGIAVSSSTDVAKAAASMVLVEPGTKVIIEAVESSRRIYQRMLTWTLNKVIKAVHFITLLTIGFFIFHDVIVTISGLMLLLFVNDFLTMFLAGDNAKSTVSPNKWNVRNITLACILLGLLFLAEGLLAIWVGVRYFALDFEQLRSLVLLTFIYSSLFRVLSVRERGPFWDSAPSRSIAITVVGSVVLFTLFAIFGIVLEPLAPVVVLVVFVMALAATLLFDFPKCWIFRKFGI